MVMERGNSLVVVGGNGGDAGARADWLAFEPNGVSFGLHGTPYWMGSSPAPAPGLKCNIVGPFPDVLNLPDVELAMGGGGVHTVRQASAAAARFGIQRVAVVHPFALHPQLRAWYEGGNIQWTCLSEVPGPTNLVLQLKEAKDRIIRPWPFSATFNAVMVKSGAKVTKLARSAAGLGPGRPVAVTKDVFRLCPSRDRSPSRQLPACGYRV